MHFRSLLLIGVLALSTLPLGGHTQITDPKDAAARATTDRVNSEVSNGVSDGVGKAAGALKGLFKKKPETADAPQPTSSQASASSNSAPAPSGSNLQTYANYDFVPGERVLFEDTFLDDQDGEFPEHWELNKGQGIVNKLNAEPAFFLTEGNYARVAPRMKTANYLPPNFTIEFDFYQTHNSSAPNLLFKDVNGYAREIFFGKGVSTGSFQKDLSADFPGDGNTFFGKWHHAAMIKKGNTIKTYVDQYRVLVMPDCGDCKLVKLEVGGIGDPKAPIAFRNFRLAEGGNANTIGQKFTDAKIVTHGINFDVDQSTLKPESMGTFNMIAQILKSNPDLKFEVGGHTDSTGGAAHNLQLSQQRADAVKTQLVTMGVDASRLNSKGYGDSKPIAGNNTPEGQANNRRVEFVKTS